MDIIGKLHHGALAEFAFDGFEGCFQRLLARFFRGQGVGFFAIGETPIR